MEDIQPELQHLYEHGRLLAEEAIINNWLPVMKCSDCGAYVDLIYNHGPQGKVFRSGKQHILPGTQWGKDVTVLCRCCSLPGCPHKNKETPNAA